jgi:hypothetical protein
MTINIDLFRKFINKLHEAAFHITKKTYDNYGCTFISSVLVIPFVYKEDDIEIRVTVEYTVSCNTSINTKVKVLSCDQNIDKLERLSFYVYYSIQQLDKN